MRDKDILRLIPEDWQDRIDRSEFEDETLRVNEDLRALASSRLNLKNPSREEIIMACSKAWNTTTVHVENSWETIINLRVKIRLFSRHYGHLFPKDENGELILGPDEIAYVYKNNEEQ